jgi:DNA primase
VIPPEFIQQLLSRLDIADVIGSQVELKKTGANLSGLCPFHGEKTPSFTVSPTKQFYHCFGCGAHGDALRFVMEYQGLSFVDGVQDLARRVGMTVPSDTRSPEEREQAANAKAQRKSLSELLAQAAHYYAQQLREHPQALDYISTRGLTERVTHDFQIGYAPPGWRTLARCFERYDNDDLLEAGLVIEAESDDTDKRRYDRFRERIMFPIRNVLGEVIGFGGRVLGKGEPKYLNSPETPVFSKGHELYGLFEARSAIRQRAHALVVEGYMDVVALAQHGIANAVATLGTACTAEHVAKLYRFTDQIVFSFDGDAAGRRAASRALQAALPHLNERRSARFLFLPTEHDPDSFVRDLGAEAFEAAVDRAEPLSGYLLRVASENCRLDTPEGRAKLLSQARPMWSQLSEGPLKRQMLGELARLARLPEQELIEGWDNARRVVTSGASYQAPEPGMRFAKRRPPTQRPLSVRPPGPEDGLLRLLLVHSGWWEKLSASTHDKLLGRGTPHANLLGWLDRIVAEHGALHWPALRTLLLADPDAMANLDTIPHLDLTGLDWQATLDSPFSDLESFLERLDRPDASALLGRSAPGQRP